MFTNLGKMRVFLVILSLCVSVCDAIVTLEKLSDVFVPTSREPDVFQYNTNSATCGTYSHDGKQYYVGGGRSIHVYDVENINQPELVYTKKLIGGTISDVEVCGEFVAVAKDNTMSPEDGQVVIYRRYKNGVMEKMHDISVGTNPRDLDFAHNCTKIVVAVEGTLGNTDGYVYDPEGLVVIIKWDTDNLENPYGLSVADFTSFNDRADEYVEMGVRWVYRGQGSGVVNTFSQDLEPESIQLDTDEKRAFVILQENNAIAILNMITFQIDEIIPLGYKDFSQTNVDLSDRDGGIRLRPWPVRGLHLPSRATLTFINYKTYLVIVNEGSERQFTQPDYPFTWRESKTGQELIAGDLLSDNVDLTVREMLADDTQLGRTRFSTVDGLDANGTRIETLYVYGGRGYSLFETGNLTMVYESQSLLEEGIKLMSPAVFNSDPTQASQTPEGSYDLASPHMGCAPDAIDTTTLSGYDIVFVGTGMPGQVITYSMLDSGPLVPRLESVLYTGGLGASWQSLYEQKVAKGVGIEELQVIHEEASPINQEILVVIGRVSGTVQFYRIRVVTGVFEHAVDMIRNLPSAVRNFGRALLPGGRQVSPVEPIAFVALGLSTVALLVGAVLLTVTVKRRRRNGRMAAKQCYDNEIDKVEH